MLGDSAHQEICEMEDANVFFSVDTGHDVPDWGYVDVRAKVYGGTCKLCHRKVRSDRTGVEDECVFRRVEMVHAL